MIKDELIQKGVKIFNPLLSFKSVLGLSALLYLIGKILFYIYCYIPSPDEYGYVLSSRWFEDSLRNGESLGEVFSAHGIYQLFIGFLYLVIGNDDLLLSNFVAILFTLGTAFIIFKMLREMEIEKWTSFLGSAIFLLIPDIFVNGHRYWLDIPAMFFSSLLMYFLIRGSSKWKVGICLLFVLLSKEYVFLLIVFPIALYILSDVFKSRDRLVLVNLMKVFVPSLIAVYVIVFLEYLPTNSILDAILNDYFTPLNETSSKDGINVASRFRWKAETFFEQLWFKFYDYAIDESIVLLFLYGFILWIYSKFRSIFLNEKFEIRGEWVIFLFMVTGFGFYMTSYIKHIRVFYPFFAPMVFYLIYPFWYWKKNPDKKWIGGIATGVMAVGLLGGICEGGIRNMKLDLIAIGSIAVFYILLLNWESRKRVMLSSLVAIILISTNFIWNNELGKNMWMGIKAQDSIFYDDLDNEFRNRLNKIVFSGNRITFDFIFHHYEFLYWVNARRTQNDKHYSRVTLRPSHYRNEFYPPDVVPSRYYKLESITEQSLDTCLNVLDYSDVLISRNILVREGISLIDRSENDQIKVYSYTPPSPKIEITPDSLLLIQ